MKLQNLAYLINHKSISDMSPQVLLEHVRDVRHRRLQVKAKERVEKEKKVKLPNPEDLSLDQIKALLSRLEK